MEEEAAGSLSQPDDAASSLGVSRFLRSLTDRQFQVMQSGMSVELTRDEMTHMLVNVVKIVSTFSRKIIVPKLREVLNVDPRSCFRQPSLDAAVTAELLADHALVYMQEGADAAPAVPLDFQTPTCLQSFKKIQSEDTQTKAAQNVSEIALKSSKSFTVSSLHSLRARLESPEYCVALPGTLTPPETSRGEDKKPHLLRSSVRIADKQAGTKSRDMVSISTLVDAMLTSLGLQGSGHSISLKGLSAVTQRVDDLFSTAANQELTEMVQLILTDRLSSLNMSNPDLHQYIALEFLGKFADESAKRLLMSCTAPRPASSSTEDIPSLVMPFIVTPESFEVSRPPSEVFADTIDLLSKGIVKNVMDEMSEASDHEEDAVVSKAEATPDIDSEAPTAVCETEAATNEKPKKRKSFFHLKMPKIFKKRFNKDNDAGLSDLDYIRSRCAADLGVSNSATSKKKTLWRTIYTSMLSFFGKLAARISLCLVPLLTYIVLVNARSPYSMNPTRNQNYSS